MSKIPWEVFEPLLYVTVVLVFLAFYVAIGDRLAIRAVAGLVLALVAGGTFLLFRHRKVKSRREAGVDER